MRRLPLLALAACGGASSKPVVTSEVPKPPPPACITPPDTATPITHAVGDGDRVMYCVATSCFELELGSGKLTRLYDLPPTRAPLAHVVRTTPGFKVCTDNDCKVLTSDVMPGTSPIHATTNESGTIAVVLLGDPKTGKGYAEVWDVPGDKKLSSFKYARGEFRCGEVSMLGETVYVAASTCDSPGARGALYTTKGVKIANVGGEDFGAYGNAIARVDETTWAFLEENANRIAIQDIVKGKLKKMIDTSALWSSDNKEALGNPGESALISLGGGKLAVIAGAPANGSVGVVDIATGKVDVTRAPMCH
jgi:hypothetical protein